MKNSTESSARSRESIDITTVVGICSPNANALVAQDPNNALESICRSNTDTIQDRCKVNRIEKFVLDSVEPDFKNMTTALLEDIFTNILASNYNPYILLAKIVGLPQFKDVDFSRLHTPYLEITTSKLQHVGAKMMFSNGTPNPTVPQDTNHAGDDVEM